MIAATTPWWRIAVGTCVVVAVGGATARAELMTPEAIAISAQAFAQLDGDRVADVAAAESATVPAAASNAAVMAPIRAEAADAGGLAGSPDGAPVAVLSPERARILLRSLTFPGWGQASVGRKKSAKVFALAELGIWTSFTAFRIQSQMRRATFERTAELFAGIDLNGRDEEYRRIVGSYLSSEEYNLLVVYREAANRYYDDPVAYREYIATHSIGGTDTWHWDSEESLLRYRSQRKDAQRASIRANTALAAAVVNRLLSMVHAVRIPGIAAHGPQSLRLEFAPGPDEDALTYRLGVRTGF